MIGENVLSASINAVSWSAASGICLRLITFSSGISNEPPKSGTYTDAIFQIFSAGRSTTTQGPLGQSRNGKERGRLPALSDCGRSHLPARY